MTGKKSTAPEKPIILPPDRADEEVDEASLTIIFQEPPDQTEAPANKLSKKRSHKMLSRKMRSRKMRSRKK